MECFGYVTCGPHMRNIRAVMIIDCYCTGCSKRNTSRTGKGNSWPYTNCKDDYFSRD
jgi:hypothetical protein